LHNARRARKKKGLSRMMDSRLSALARAAFSSENLLRGKGDTVTIAVDAMGSDRAPKPEVEGAIQAARLGLAKVILVGPEAQLRDELALHPSAAKLPLEIVNATQVISMDEKAATAVRSKRDSTMRVGLRLVREGRRA
jgi:glycerol-3-phosphate acyltransferase PlsX